MRQFVCLLLLASCANAATLEKLQFEEMVAKSTSIIRGRIGNGTTQQQGPLYYTHYPVTVVESYKGQQAGTIDVLVPGGTIGRSHQTVAGTPDLTAGSEMVLFLWTSSKGQTHVIGLSQGAFQLSRSKQGEMMLSRAPIRATLLEANGRPGHDNGLQMSMSEFRSRVGSALRRSR